MGFLGITVYSYFKYINPTFYPKYVDNKEYVEKDNVQLYYFMLHGVHIVKNYAMKGRMKLLKH